MRSKTWYVLIATLVIGSTLLVACGSPEPEVLEVEVTRVVEREGETVVETETVIVTATPEPVEEVRPNVLRLGDVAFDEIKTLDPSLGTDTSSIQVIDELTIGLTRLDDEANMHAGMAESWDVSDDGLTYVFHLVEGIPWVRWNGEAVEEVLDCEGNVRYVTAQDFEYGIKRTSNPDTASNYAYVLGFAVQGVDALSNAEGWSDLSDEEKQALIDGVAAKALDDYTLEVTFTTSAVYNLNIIGLWVAHAEPQWLIEGDECTEARGDRWTEPGFNQSYGPFVLQEWIHDASLTMVKNPFWPGLDSVPVPQIDEVVIHFLLEPAAFAEYEAGNLDTSAVPLADMDRVKADPVLSEDLTISPQGCTYYYGFNTSKPPMDNVHLRRAFSYAIDRLGVVENVTKGGQQPAQWFCRPGMAGCPTMDTHPELGIGYDVEAAQAELQAYLDEMGYASVSEIPEIILMYNTSEGHKRIAEAIAEMWSETLGIQVTITNQEFRVFLDTLEEDAPHIWRAGWCLDYPDANNWSREVFAIGGNKQEATQWFDEEFTALLEAAAVEPDPDQRREMYAQAEQMLAYDVAAIAPIYWYTNVVVTKPWVNRGYSQHGQEAYETWSLDLKME